MAALPDAVRVELEEIQSSGGLGHLQEVSQQIRVSRPAGCVEAATYPASEECLEKGRAQTGHCCKGLQGCGRCCGEDCSSAGCATAAPWQPSACACPSPAAHALRFCAAGAAWCVPGGAGPGGFRGWDRACALLRPAPNHCEVGTCCRCKVGALHARGAHVCGHDASMPIDLLSAPATAEPQFPYCQLCYITGGERPGCGAEGGRRPAVGGAAGQAGSRQCCGTLQLRRNGCSSAVCWQRAASDQAGSGRDDVAHKHGHVTWHLVITAPPPPLTRRAHYGPRWKRPPSSQLTKSMRDTLNGYRGNLRLGGGWAGRRAGDGALGGDTVQTVALQVLGLTAARVPLPGRCIPSAAA